MSFLGLLFAAAVIIPLWWLYSKGVAASARSSTSAAYARRGFAEFTAGDDDRAIAAFTESIIINPKNFAAFLGRGKAYIVRGNHQDAIADLTVAIQLDPSFAEAYSSRADAYLQCDDLEKAITDLTMAIRLSPNSAEARFHRAAANVRKYGLQTDPGQWRTDAPGYDMVVADLIAADRLGLADPKLCEAAKGILSLIREYETTYKQPEATQTAAPQSQPARDLCEAPAANPNLSPCPDCGNSVSRFAEACPQCGRPVALTPEQRAEQQERERQWAAERERLAREERQREREQAERLATQLQRRHDEEREVQRRWEVQWQRRQQEELERQREAQRQWQQRKDQWEERICKALRWGEDQSRTLLAAIASAAGSVVQRLDRVLRVQTRRQRETQTRAFLVSTRWWLRKARRVLRDRARRLEQSHKENT